MKKVFFITSLGLTLILSSCDKQDKSQLEFEQSIESVGTKKLIKEENENLLKIYLWDNKKRLDFEERNGYKSFATRSEEIYDSIDFDRIETEEELYRIVEQNSFYIEMVVDQYGEFEILPKYFTERKRYYMDENLQEVKIFSNLNKGLIRNYEIEKLNSDDMPHNLDDLPPNDNNRYLLPCTNYYTDCVAENIIERNFKKQIGNNRTRANYCISRPDYVMYDWINWSFTCVNEKKILVAWVLESHTINMSCFGKIWNLQPGFFGYSCPFFAFEPESPGIPNKYSFSQGLTSNERTFTFEQDFLLIKSYISPVIYLNQYKFYLHALPVGEVVNETCNGKLYLLKYITEDQINYYLSIVQTFE